MKQCPKCQSQYPENAKFCSKCGVLLNNGADSHIEISFKNENSHKKKKSSYNKWLWMIVLFLVAVCMYNSFMASSYLLVSQDTVNYPVSGKGERTVYVEYDGLSYKVLNVPSWLEITKYSTYFSIQASVNKTGFFREAVLTVKSGKCEDYIVVFQQGNPTFFSVSPEYVNFGKDSESQSISVEHDGLDFMIESSPSWVSVVKKGNGIIVSADDNTSSKNKEGVIVLTCGNLTKKIRVKQGAATTYMRFEPTSLRLPKGASTHDLVWHVGIDYDGYDFDINYNSDWLNVDKDDNLIFIRASDNETGANRYGSITIKSGNINKRLEVMQFGSATKMQLDTKKIIDDRFGGRSYTINVNTDGTKYDINYPTFLELKECELDHFIVKFKDNDEYYRKGTIRVFADNASAAVTVIQGGKCDICKGSGTNPCPSCRGEGGWWNFNSWVECFLCKGTGTINCTSCGGKKYKEPK